MSWPQKGLLKRKKKKRPLCYSGTPYFLHGGAGSQSPDGKGVQTLVSTCSRAFLVGEGGVGKSISIPQDSCAVRGWGDTELFFHCVCFNLGERAWCF